MKRLLLAACAAVFMLAAQMTAYAGSESQDSETVAACITKDEACSIAKNYITEGSKFQFAEHSGNGYEVVYYNGDLQEYYQININSLNGEMQSYKSWLFSQKGSKNVTFSEEQAKEIVLAEFPDASDMEVGLDYKGDLKSYVVRFTVDGMKGSCAIDPESGTIIGKQVQSS